MSRGKMETAFVVIDYEIMMFLCGRKKLKLAIDNDELRVFVNNALVESRVLHIRVLTEFLLSRNEKRDTDIKLNQLLPKVCVQHKAVIETLQLAYDTALPKISKSPKTLIDQLLAHATIERGSKFDWSPVINAMEQPIVNTLNALPTHQFPNLALLSEII